MKIINLFMVLAGISIFVNSNATHVYPLSESLILIDHDECLQIEFEQASLTFDELFRKDHFRWNQYSFTLSTFKTSVKAPLFLDVDELPYQLAELIHSLIDLAKIRNLYFEEIKIHQETFESKTS